MARTALLTRLQQLFAEYNQRESEQSGLTRRDFLKASGAAVGAAALTGSIPALARASRARSSSPPTASAVGCTRR